MQFVSLSSYMYRKRLERLVVSRLGIDETRKTNYYIRSRLRTSHNGMVVSFPDGKKFGVSDFPSGNETTSWGRD